ncbi:MAG: hypothetical protein GQ467_05795 [Mariprofundaceae bacterium]|nr:hypothetical protein [Mariprofundaceae bacterium]
MSFSEIYLLWSESAALSAVIWSVVLTVLTYLAREPMHRMIEAVSSLAKNAFQQASESLLGAEKRLSERNTEVLIAAGREASEHLIEREFVRINRIVETDLAEYPTLHRKISDVIVRIDEDYKQSSDVPPEAPGWGKAISAVAQISTSKSDPMVGQILESIHGSLEKNHEKTLDEYRKSSRERHMLLKKMLPSWRGMNSDLKQVDQNVNALMERSRVVDRQMEEYEKIINETDSAKKTLSSSSLTQFFIAGFVLAIAIGGAMINFNLIARPMQEMVGGSSVMMGYKTANIAALVIILVEVAMGLFLMESLRITRLFPVIASMKDDMRMHMAWITFTILLSLASVEAGLAYMREVLAQDDAALRASLLSGTVAAMGVSDRWITTAAQMGMGFILPFALVFVAIPLESFIHSSRTVLGILAAGTLRALAFAFAVLANTSHYIGRMLTSVYDLFIFIPLWIETRVRGSNHSEKKKSRGFNPLQTDSMKEVS